MERALFRVKLDKTVKNTPLLHQNRNVITKTTKETPVLHIQFRNRKHRIPKSFKLKQIRSSSIQINIREITLRGSLTKTNPNIIMVR
jgi:hypothetical protein